MVMNLLAFFIKGQVCTAGDSAPSNLTDYYAHRRNLVLLSAAKPDGVSLGRSGH